MGRGLCPVANSTGHARIWTHVQTRHVSASQHI